MQISRAHTVSETENLASSRTPEGMLGHSSPGTKHARTLGVCCSAHRTRRTLSRLHNVLKHSSRLIVGMSVAMTAAVATIASMTILLVVTGADKDTAAARRAVSPAALCRISVVTSLRSWPRTQHPPFAPTYRSRRLSPRTCQRNPATRILRVGLRHQSYVLLRS